MLVIFSCYSSFLVFNTFHTLTFISTSETHHLNPSLFFFSSTLNIIPIDLDAYYKTPFRHSNRTGDELSLSTLAPHMFYSILHFHNPTFPDNKRVKLCMSIRSTMQSYVIIFKKTLGSWILVKLVLFSALSRRTHKQKYTIFEMQNEKPEDFFPEDSYVIYSIIRCNSTAYDDRWRRWKKS